MMDKTFKKNLYKRLGELIQGDDGRFENYIEKEVEKVADVAERQRAFIDRRKAEGKVQFSIWAEVKIIERLKKLCPGPRGGVDWALVMNLAIIQAKSKSKE